MVSAWCRCVCCWRTAGVLPLLVGIGDMGDNGGCGNAAVVVVVVVVAATQRRWLCAEEKRDNPQLASKTHMCIITENGVECGKAVAMQKSSTGNLITHIKNAVMNSLGQVKKGARVKSLLRLLQKPRLSAA